MKICMFAWVERHSTHTRWQQPKIAKLHLKNENGCITECLTIFTSLSSEIEEKYSKATTLLCYSQLHFNSSS